jgi:tRNA modification GTPase
LLGRWAWPVSMVDDLVARDTIFSLATARGKAGIAVIRVSGPQAGAAVAALCGAPREPRRAALRVVSWKGQQLDEAIVLTFEAGASFTGEEVAELHLHGSMAVIASVIRALSEMEGLRQAEPGEFTRRALENGCLDLAQVEGLADLIDSETEAQRRQAMRVLSGAVGRKAEVWRQGLIRSAALIEATIDFADEDVPVDVHPEVRGILSGILEDLRSEMAGSRAAERVREGFEVAIMGRPNAGKSTLLNALAGREAAITSARAGTTRDVIEVRMNLEGLPVTVLDTAGLRESTDEIEKIGIERAIERGRLADLRVFLLDGEGSVPLVEPTEGDIVVQGRADERAFDAEAVSGRTGQGLDRLIKRIVSELEGRVASAGVLTRERHRMAILRAMSSLESAMTELGSGSGRHELVAAELRLAISALDQLVGRIDVEDLLDEIFASFCIGK